MGGEGEEGAWGRRRGLEGEMERGREGEREGEGKEKGKGKGKGKGRFKGIAGSYLSHSDEDVECELHSLSQKLRIFTFSSK